MPDSSPILDIAGLSARFQAAKPVLNNLTLQVGRGERVALLGPSGTGKTTLFRCINGFVRADAGSIRVDGEEVTQMRGKKLRQLRSRIGFVSQRHDLVESLSVHQNVMAGALGRWSAARALRFLLWPTQEELHEASAALALVGLEDKLRERTASLSGGEHQRVAIARAMVQRPVLLMADEPVASLDPERAEQVLTLLGDLAAKKQVTLLCSLHQPALAERFFDRIIELRDGRVVDDRAGLGEANDDQRIAAIAANI